MKSLLYATPFVLIIAIAVWTMKPHTADETIQPTPTEQEDVVDWHTEPTPPPAMVFRLLEGRILETYQAIALSAQALEELRLSSRADPSIAQNPEVRALIQTHLNNQQALESALYDYVTFMRLQTNLIEVSLLSIHRSLPRTDPQAVWMRYQFSALEEDFHSTLRTLNSLESELTHISESRSYTAQLFAVLYNDHP